MNKNTLIFFLFFTSNLVYSQSKSETLSWLSEYYEKYSTCGEAYCEIYVDDNNFLFLTRRTSISYEINKINLKKLKRIIFKQEKIISTWSRIYLECDSEEYGEFGIGYLLNQQLLCNSLFTIIFILIRYI
jgi:hypothetical protein